MRARAWVAVAALAAVVVAGVASGSTGGATGTLRVNAKLATAWKFADRYCPAGKPVNISCIHFVGTGAIPGLGIARSTYVKTMESNGCRITQFNEAVLAVAGRGSLRLTRPGRACGPTAPGRVGPLKYEVSSGTGAYKGATGSLTYRGRADFPNFDCGPCGTGEDTWSGTITVPRLVFDVTPPELTGAVTMVVNSPADVEALPVSFLVTAEDDVDGPRPVACKPRSGSLFKVGRTAVSCESSDSSGNTARAQFSILVERS